MASERNTERIIDLLYDELTEEEASSLRNELADSAELRADHDALNIFLDDIRDAMPMAEVSPRLHQSIMDVARNAAAEQEEKRRPIATQEQPTRGIWGRLSGGKAGQIALVATVLFSVAFVSRFVNLDDNHSSLAPSSSEVATMDLPPIKEASKREIATETPQGVALNEPEEIEGAEYKNSAEERVGSDSPDPVAVDTDSLDRGALEKEKSDDAKTIATGEANDGRRDQKQRVTKKSPRKPADRKMNRATTVKKSAKDLDSTLSADLFGDGMQSANSSTRTRTNKPAAEPKLEAAAEEQAPMEDKAMPQKSGKSVYQAPRQSIGAVEQLYSSGDYGTTIQAANEFVALGSGSRTETARALQLKAQALAKTGRYQEAIRVYDSLKKNYPSYQSSSINAARSEISRKLEESPQTKKKKEKRRAKPKKSYDFEADEAKQSLDSLTE